MKATFSLDNKSIIRVINIIIAYIVGLGLLWFFKEALLLVVLAFFLALALNPPVSYIASKLPGGSRGLATLIAFLIVVGAIGALAMATIPTLVEQSIEFIDEAPQTIDELREGDGVVADFLNKTNFAERANEGLSDFGSRLGDISGPVFSSIGKLGSSLITIFTVLVLTFFMIVEGPKRVKALWRIYPPEHVDHHRMLADKMYDVITGYVNGQLLIALISAVTSLVVMLIVGVPYALALAAVVGILGLIPLIGATIAAVIVVLVALTQSVAMAVVMGIFYIVYQQLENNAIQPYIQARTLDMSPLIVLMAVVVGYTSAGILGTLLAIPIAGCARVLVLDSYRAKRKDVLSHPKSKKK